MEPLGANSRVVTNAGQASADVYIYDKIGTLEGEVSAAMVARALAMIGPVTELHAYVNSIGGSVYQATGIYAAFRDHPAKVIMHVTVAMSAATHVVMAGDVIEMSENGVWMMHEPSQGVEGTVDEILNQVEQLRQIREAVTNTYAARSKLPVAQVAEILKKQTWMSAVEAKRLGFVDVVTPNKTVSAHVDLTTFTDIPDWCLTTLKTLEPEMTMPDPTPTPAPVVAPAQPAPAPTPAPTMAAPATLPTMTVDQLSALINAGVQKALTGAIAEDRKKCADIVAMCDRAKVPKMSAAFLADPNMTVELVQMKLFDVLCAVNTPVGPGGPTDPSMVTPADPVMKYKKEYADGLDLFTSQGITEDVYIRSRKHTDGIK